VTSPAAGNRAGVDDATVQNLVQQWRPELMYCYTQFGLREHAALTGTLMVRVALTPNGAVQQAVIASRQWNGEGGADVETCIQSRVSAWRFPPAAVGSSHEFSIDFGNR